MKKYLSYLAVFFIYCFSLWLFPQSAEATDIWAYTAAPQDGNYQAYVVSESIQWNNDYSKITCAVKQVKDGSVQKVVFWNFDRLSDEWRYQTSTMQKPNSFGHTNRVYPNSWGAYILKICIDYLR